MRVYDGVSSETLVRIESVSVVNGSVTLHLFYGFGGKNTPHTLVPNYLIRYHGVAGGNVVNNHIIGGFEEIVIDLAGIISGNVGLFVPKIVERGDSDAFRTVHIGGVGIVVSVENRCADDEEGPSGITNGDGHVFGGFIRVFAVVLQKLGVTFFGFASSKKHHNARGDYDAFIQIFNSKKHSEGLPYGRVFLDPASHVVRSTAA